MFDWCIAHERLMNQFCDLAIIANKNVIASLDKSTCNRGNSDTIELLATASQQLCAIAQ